MYCRCDDNGNADHYSSDYDAKGRIVIFLDLMMNIEDPAQNKIRDRKKDQPNDNKDQGCDEYLSELIKSDNHAQDAGR